MSTSSDVLAGLTVDQATAAALTGPVLVLAGAGTGKTKTLTAGVAHRITARSIPASRILAVTFTNKAAAEMLTRIRAGLGDGGAPSCRHVPRPRRTAVAHRARGRGSSARLRHHGCR